MFHQHDEETGMSKELNPQIVAALITASATLAAKYIENRRAIAFGGATNVPQTLAIRHECQNSLENDAKMESYSAAFDRIYNALHEKFVSGHFPE